MHQLCYKRTKVRLQSGQSNFTYVVSLMAVNYFDDFQDYFSDVNGLKRPKRPSNCARRDHSPRNHLPPPSVHGIAHCKVHHVSL